MVENTSAGVNVADLRERVRQFQTMELPGQPMMLHMGTSYLVNDLWSAVKLLAERQKGGDA
ncbi:hypothetical protein [Caenibius sp. WL]|uniref:hypothetical protein n=1 Tax=Caenibius sp. WL TaxID=2872646 RepID=UPI001C99BA26|nr:hypothetical protein [Caenibius sp. WL]QZP06847.1 hypothetical protein K5X80_08905 [Caenibius sp. WL]